MRSYTVILLIPFLVGCRVSNEIDLGFSVDIPEEHYVKLSEGEEKAQDYDKWWQEALVGAPEELLSFAKKSNPDLGKLTQSMKELLYFYGIDKNTVRTLETGEELRGPLNMQRAAPGAVSVGPFLRQFRHRQNIGALSSENVHRVSYFDAKFEIDLFRRTLYYQKAAVEDIIAAKELKRDFFSYLKSQILKEVLVYRYLNHMSSLAKDYKNLQEGLLKKISARAEYGLETDAICASAKAMVETISDKLTSYKRDKIRQLNAIAKLTGMNDHKMLKTILKEDQKNYVLDHEVITSTPIAVIAKRPDLRSARRAVNRGAYQVGVAMAEKYPKFYLSSNLESLANQLHRLFDPQQFCYMFGLDMATNFLQGWQAESEEKVKKTQFKAALYHYKKCINEALVDISNNVLQLLDSRDKLTQVDRDLDRAVLKAYKTKTRREILGQAMIDQMHAYHEELLAREAYLFACQQNSQNVIALVRSLGL